MKEEKPKSKHFMGSIVCVRSVGRLLGNIWPNLAIVVSFWSFNPLEEADREARRINQKR